LVLTFGTKEGCDKGILYLLSCSISSANHSQGSWQQQGRQDTSKAFVPHLIPGGISHLQYVDDTLILIQNSEENIANLELLLMCFEDMSGLKINYHKSEVIVMGQSLEEQQRVANKFNCTRGSFPFMYLGLPISDRKLCLKQWLFLVRKLAGRIEPWLSKLLT
jgi:hypothetical protein